jgi:hypothetical protein
VGFRGVVEEELQEVEVALEIEAEGAAVVVVLGVGSAQGGVEIRILRGLAQDSKCTGLAKIIYPWMNVYRK